MSYDLDMIVNEHCKCGENPLWDERTGMFFWTDIPTRRLFLLDPATGEHEQVYHGDQQVGGFTFQEDGRLLLFRETDIALLHDDGTVEPKIPFADDGVPRFNDVMADPAGRVMAGTMGKDRRGGLYLLDHDGRIENLWRGTNCSNGMAFTADRKTMYWTDSTARTIHAYDYDPAGSTLTNPRTIVRIGEDQGVPDGMTIDTEGRLYSTRFGGAGVFIYSPAGDLLDRIDMPVERITSCCFGGEGLNELYITTAGGDPDERRGEAGAVYRVTLDVQGMAEYRSTIAV
jgi:D-xylonolactonase